MLDAALQKLLSVIDSLVPSNSHSGSGRAGASGGNTSGSAGASGATGTAAAGTSSTTTSTSMPKNSLVYEASPAVPASAGKPARGPEYRVLAAKEGWPKLEGVTTLYELWTTSVEKYGPRRCLGWRPKVGSKEEGRDRWGWGGATKRSIDLFSPSFAPSSLIIRGFAYISDTVLTCFDAFCTLTNEKQNHKHLRSTASRRTTSG